MDDQHERGIQFERRALEIARAIHDPLGLQGAVIFEGAEHDAIFVGEETINAFEFTLRRDQQKAVKDAEKIGRILRSFSKKPGNQYKALKGWFVTNEEPTADQRKVVTAQSEKVRFPIHAVSISTLKKQIVDVEAYLRCRGAAPFGSTIFTASSGFPQVDIHPRFKSPKGSTSDVAEVADQIVAGNRLVMTGEFGVGKSFALRSIYQQLRRQYFKNPAESFFPVHINLRDCVGLRSPAEILRRHCEEIGFDGERGLISSWRAGSCCLLLDGFDEIAPTRWMGGASDLKQVRWQALAPVRNLILEAPLEMGIITCGRSHFFSSTSEMLSAIGFSAGTTICTLEDFSEEQLTEYFAKIGADQSTPEWLPNRPLLLGYLFSQGMLKSNQLADTKSPSEAWRFLLKSICDRESKMFTAVRPETIKSILSRVATLAKSKGEELSPIGMNEMKQAYFEINSVQPDDEGILLLQRLPGLATSSGKEEENRVFVDKDLAATAYGEDLSLYLLDHRSSNHPLARPASWVIAASELSIEVTASCLTEISCSRRTIETTIEFRLSNNWSDAVVADTIRVADAMFPDSEPTGGYTIDGVLFENLILEASPIISNTTIQNCVINILDLNNIVDKEHCPTFIKCIIGMADGIAAIPPTLTACFIDTEIESFSVNYQTTAGLLQLPLADETLVALTILKKVYTQRGVSRKERSLYRGLDQRRQGLVSGVISKLLSAGWLHPYTSKGTTIYIAVKTKKADAIRALEAPHSFHL